MLLKKMFAVSLVALGAFGLSASFIAHAEDVAAAMKVIDTDHDGTIDQAEAKKAGTAMFKAYDKNHDGTIDAKEAPLAMGANTDKDTTVDADEYTKAIEAAFKKADTNNDGKVDAKELEASTGSDLKTLIVPKG